MISGFQDGNFSILGKTLINLNGEVQNTETRLNRLPIAFDNLGARVDHYNNNIRSSAESVQNLSRQVPIDTFESWTQTLDGQTATIQDYYGYLGEFSSGLGGVRDTIGVFRNMDPENQQQFATAIGATNSQLGSYLSNAASGGQQASTSMFGYIKSLIGAKAASLGLQVASAALNAAMSMGISVAISAAIGFITKLITAQEEARKAALEAADEYESVSTSMEHYLKTYQALHRELNQANTTQDRQNEIKKEMLRIQNELNDKYGEEYDKINLVSNAYSDQTKELKKYQKEIAKDHLRDNKSGIEKASSKMEKKRNYVLNYAEVNPNMEDGKAILEIAKKYENQGMIIGDSPYGNGLYMVRLEADAEDAQRTINSFLDDVYDKADEMGTDSYLFSDIIAASLNSLDSANTIIDDYGQIYNQALMAQISSDDDLANGYTEATNAVKEYNKAVAGGNPNKIIEARTALGNVQSSIDLTSDKWVKYENIMNEIFDQADTRIYDFQSDITGNKDGLRELIDALKGKSVDQLNTMAEDSNDNPFKKLRESANAYGLEIKDVIALLQKMNVVQADATEPPPNNPSALDGLFSPASEEGDYDFNQELKAYQAKISDLQPYLDKVSSGIMPNPDEVLTLAENYKLTANSADEYAQKIQELMDLSDDGILSFIDSEITYAETEEAKEQLETIKNAIIATNAEAQNSSDAITQFFSSIGNASVSDIISEFDVFGSGMTSLNEALASWKDNKGKIDTKDLTGLEKTFGNLDSYEDFLKIVTSSKDVDEVQKAFNHLTTEYIYASGILNGLSSEHENLFIQLMKQQGIVSANDMVMSHYAQALKEINDQGLHIDTITAEEANTFLRESDVPPEAKAEIADMILQKNIANGLTIDTAEDVAQLDKLAKQAGITTDALTIMNQMYNLTQLQSKLDALTFSNPIGDFVKKAAYTVQIKNLEKGIAKGKKSLQKDISEALKGKDKTKAEINDQNPITPSSGSGSAQSKSFQKEYDNIQTLIDNLQTKIDNKLNTITEDTSHAAKKQAYDKVVGYFTSQLDAYKKGQAYYMQELNKLKKKFTGNDLTLLSKVVNGDISISEIKDEALANKIDEYITLSGKIKNFTKGITDANKSIIENLKLIADLDIAKIDAAFKRLKSIDDNTDSTNKLKEARGKSLTEKDYTREIQENKNQIKKENKKVTRYEHYYDLRKKGKLKNNKKTQKKVAKKLGVTVKKAKSHIAKINSEPKSEWRNVKRDSLIKVKNLKAENVDHRKNRDNIELNKLKIKQNNIERSNNLIRNENALKEKSGKFLTAKDYEREIAGNNDSKANWEATIKILENKLANAKKNGNDKAVEELTEELSSAHDAVYDLCSSNLDLQSSIDHLRAAENARKSETNDFKNSLSQSEEELQKAEGKKVTQEAIDGQITSSRANQSLWKSDSDDAYANYVAALAKGEDAKANDEYNRYLESLAKSNQYGAQAATKEQERNYLKVEEYDNSLRSQRSETSALNDAIELKGDNVTAADYGKILESSDKEKELLDHKLASLQEIIRGYEVGSDLYNQTLSEIENVESEIRSCKKSQKDYNKAILEIPVKQLEKARTVLEKQLDTLNKTHDQLDASSGAIVSVLDEEIKKRKEIIDAMTEANDEAERAMALQKAKFNLDKAMNNKTNKVLKDGKWVYEADQDTIRESQESLSKAQQDVVIAGLQKEIEEWEEYKARIGETSGQYEKDKNESIANELLGIGWKTSALNMDDNLVSKLQSGYYANEQSIDFVNQQMENIDESITTIHETVKSYDDGELTFDQANNAVSLIGDFTGPANLAAEKLTNDPSALNLTTLRNNQLERIIDASDSLITPDWASQILESKLTELAKSYHDISTLTGKITGNTASNTREVTINMGEMHFHEVNDVNTLSRTIVQQFQNLLKQEMYKG